LLPQEGYEDLYKRYQSDMEIHKTMGATILNNQELKKKSNSKQ